MNILKRNGNYEPLDFSKIENHINYACAGVDGVNVSEVMMNAVIQFDDGMSSSHVQDIMIQSAINLIAKQAKYTVVAARLFLQQLRKDAYGKSWKPPTIRDHLNKHFLSGRYNVKLLQYSASELEQLNSVIDFSIEENMSYPALKTYVSKYLTKTENGKYFETPQMANMLRFMTAFVNTENRIDKIVLAYKLYNENKFSLPSPSMRGMRTPLEQYNSCALMKVDDSLSSFAAINDAILTLSSKMYGLGLDGSAIRSRGANVRNGEITHTGAVGFIQMFEKVLNSCSQGGMRKGSMTYYYPIWHYDVEDFIMLRDHDGTDDTRCKTLMYGIQIHKHFWNKLIDGEVIYLFDPHDVPDMYEAFFKPKFENEFEILYEKNCKRNDLRKREIQASILFADIARQMYQTGKIFIANVDLMNQQTPFENDTIYSSNLCMEIALPTKPLINGANDPKGLISLCTLSAVNWSAHTSPEDLEQTMGILVEFMNESLHSQPAYLKPAENSNKWFAPLGIGVTNLAHFMAKGGLKYGNPDDLSVVHEWMEATYYYALKASMNYAKNNPDRIPEKFNDISYSKGKFVFEDFAGMKNHPDICSDWSLKRNWDGLTYDINEFGLANSTVIAIMPAETSSIPQNLTNSIEPVAFEKGSTSGVMTFTPPDYELYADNYAVEFELSNEDYLKTASVCQRFNDQAISLNLRFKRDEDGMTDVNEIIETLLLARSLALKTIYYTKNRSYTDINAIEEFDDSGECESCKL